MALKHELHFLVTAEHQVSSATGALAEAHAAAQRTLVVLEDRMRSESAAASAAAAERLGAAGIA